MFVVNLAVVDLIISFTFNYFTYSVFVVNLAIVDLMVSFTKITLNIFYNVLMIDLKNVNLMVNFFFYNYFFNF